MKLHPRQLILPASLLGAFMIGLALLLKGWNWEKWYPQQVWSGEISLGIALGVFFAGLIWFASEHIESLGELRNKVLDMLQIEQMQVWHALLLGLLAGVPEEIFFRGALQPLTHVIIAAMIFGALHYITPLYVVYATIAGLLLGLLAEWRGDLWAATAAHVSYDACLFLFVIIRRLF